MTVRVVVVDNEEGGRVACREMLERHPSIEVADLLTHSEAIARSEWDNVDVLLLDAGDLNNKRDNIPGAFVAQAVRAMFPLDCGRGPIIVVLTAYHREGAVLLRMKDAGADYIESRSKAMRSAEALQNVVLSPHELAEPNPPEDLRASAGIRRDVDSNALVAALNEVGELYQIGPESLEPHVVVRVNEPDRSRWHSMKVALGRYLVPRNVEGEPMPGATTPQKKQIQRVWHLLTQLKDDR